MVRVGVVTVGRTGCFGENFSMGAGFGDSAVVQVKDWVGVGDVSKLWEMIMVRPVMSRRSGVRMRWLALASSPVVGSSRSRMGRRGSRRGHGDALA